MKQPGGSKRRSWALKSLLKEFSSSQPHRAPATSLSAATAASFLAIRSLTSVKLRQASFLHRLSLMGGRQAGPTISRRDSWNAGKRSGKCIPSADSLSAQKLSPRQTTQHRLLELSSSAPCSLFSTKHIVTEHLRHHAIATEEVHLKAMCLLLSARFRVDSADVFF